MERTAETADRAEVVGEQQAMELEAETADLADVGAAAGADGSHSEGS